MPVKNDPSVGWTRRSVAVSVLLAMEDQRKQAGLRLVRLREQRGWNQEELAHEAKLSVKTVSRFENGRHDGRRNTIKRLAEALGVNEQDITGPPPAPLGLDAEAPSDDQLDRIEAKLDALLAALTQRAGTTLDLGQAALEALQSQAPAASSAPPAATRRARSKPGRGSRAA